MTHKTKGIVLRSIKYGETSLVVTIFTEMFGIQTYMVNGVRTSKKSAAKANLFQPTATVRPGCLSQRKQIHATDKRILLGLSLFYIC